ncbi:GNAT family N-acetyltransferase [Frigidibacter sp.]|uniref:GNAT family N-acetyltransferase n=1 Tax=Frigidibacter sp. TaxID=2586418 RepID=UPI002733C1A5|nr:GNAT family N-acetyltransferase [Frigidibacter sp.]MDP3341829.1 GNAT family N-acetyltransferase [Frigidibacter sp.]
MEVRVTEDLAACLALRRTVFIEEQGVPEADEVDDLDGQAVHLLALVDGVPMGSARLLRSGETGKIGRVCVLAAARGTGLGVALMEKALAVLAEDRALQRAKLGAQTHAMGFYERLGFVAEGAEYLDAGIPHRDMVRSLR